MSDKTCKTCEWWDCRPARGKDVGDCLWLPPTVAYKAARSFHDGISERHDPEGSLTARPETRADDRCGQWREKEKAPVCAHVYTYQLNGNGDVRGKCVLCGNEYQYAKSGVAINEEKGTKE